MTTENTRLPALDFVGRFYALKDHIDAVNAKNAPLEAELAKLNLEAEAARLKANAVSAKIDEGRGGGAQWLAVKREFRIIAAGLGRIPPRPGSEAAPASK